MIFGCIDANKLFIHCANGVQDITELQEITERILNCLKRQFYAFNFGFESSVWSNQIEIRIDFNGELQSFRFESKRDTVATLQIPNYNAPFYDVGVKCIDAWSCGNIKRAINQSKPVAGRYENLLDMEPEKDESGLEAKTD